MRNNVFTFQMLVRLPQSPEKVWHDESQPAVKGSVTKQKQIIQTGRKQGVNKTCWDRILDETGLWRKDTGTGN